jgi:threonine dehydrogenase-like Zn-dependent dehydrogenase
MKQAIVYGAGDLRIEERSLEEQPLQPHQVYVETEITAFSTGTELGNYLGDSTYVPNAPDYPRGIGYSNVGVIRRVGAAVAHLKPGQRVFSTKPHQSAFVALQDELLVPVPEGIRPEVASLAYLNHLGLAALRQARYEAGEHVAVVGLGVIGLCTIWLARAMGAKVVGISNSAIRSKAAIGLGAHSAFMADDQEIQKKLCEVFGEIGADIVVLTANPWAAYRLSVEIVRCAGRISVLGFPGRDWGLPDFNPLDPRWFYAKQLTLLAAGFAPRVDCAPSDLRFNTRRNICYILDLMASHTPPLDSIISHRLAASHMKEVYELARQHSKGLMAAVFDWRSLE